LPAVEPVPRPEHEVEGPEDRTVRLTTQAEHRAAQWRRRLPKRYADATLTAMHPWQDPGGRIARWLEHGSQVLVLTGASDRGKSWLAHAVGNDALAAGRGVICWSVPDLNAAMRPDGDPRAYESACQAEVLVLDDLGREQVSEWTLEQLTRILDTRYREGRRTVVTTNLTYRDVTARYGVAVAGRITDGATIATFTESMPSLRQPAPW
jgi:DNA replication protein DnaC